MNYIEYLRKVEQLSVEGLQKRELTEEEKIAYMEEVENQQFKWGEKNA